MALFGMTLLELQETCILQNLEAKLVCTLLGETDESWNLYNPSCWLAKPIIFRDVESCMTHWLGKNLKKQDKDSHNFATDIRFNLNEGE